MASLDRHMPDPRINADGTLPMYRDPETGEARPTAVAEAVLSGTADDAGGGAGGGPHTHAEYADAAHGHPHDHVGVHAPTHAHPYAADDHQHPAGGEHDHDGTYEPVHAHPYAGTAHNHDAAYAGTAHVHAAHDHDATYAAGNHAHPGVYSPVHAHPYAADDHSHPAGDHPDLASHESLGLVTDTDLTGHAATAHGTQAHAIGGPLHTGSLTAADVGASPTGHNHDAAYATTGHSHPGGSEAFPVGSLFLSAVETNPAQLLGYGQWEAFGQGRMLLGWNTGDTDGATGGSATHTHAGHTDHAALTHSGAAVADHAAHTHAYTQTVNHTHPLATGTGSTGNFAQVIGTVDTSSGGTGASPTQTALGTLSGNPAGGVASGTTANPSATLTHSVTQPGQHAAQSHSAHDTASNLPPYVIVRVWKRTA